MAVALCPIGYTVIYSCIEEKYFLGYRKDTCAHIVLYRFSFLSFVAGIAASVPQLENIMSLVGSFVTATVGFLLPAVAHTLLLYKQLSRFTIVANMIFLFSGLIVLFAGVYTSIAQIAGDY
jgi:hypothetical protein